MPTVEFARHLHRFFPVLANGPLRVEATTAAQVIEQIDKAVPGLADYIVDERGSLRLHVNMFIGDEMIVDRKNLRDPVAADDRVSIYQALSGGS